MSGFLRVRQRTTERRRTIRHRLLHLFLAGMLIPLLLLSAVLSVFVYTLTTNQMSKQYESELTIAGNEMAGAYANLTDMARNLMRTNGTSGLHSSDSLYSVVTHNVEEAYPFDIYKLPVFRKIQSIISSTYLRQSPYINGIYLLMANGNTYSFSLSADFPGALDYLHAAWYQHAVRGEAIPAVISGGIRELSPQSSIAFVWPVAEVQDSAQLGAILIDCNRQFFAPIPAQTVENDVHVYLVDAHQNQWIVEPDAESAAQYRHIESRCATLAGSYIDLVHRRLLVWHTASELKLIYDAPNPFLSSRFSGLLYASLGTILLAIVIAVASAAIVSRSFARPLANLSANMASSSSHLPSASERYNGEDEFVQLYKGYNRMIAAVDDYITENYMYKLSNMELRMKAIERQIDTHFMYNTLDCVYSLAITSGAEEIASVVKGLGDMFRYVTKIASPTIALREEIAYTQNYLTIQKARYGELVDFSLAVPEDLSGCTVLKLSLQPLVENALKHGYGYRDGVHHVSVRADMEEDLLAITVVDDGRGMTSEVLEALRASLLMPDESADTGKSGIGLDNIRKRLSLVFGDRASLAIDSQCDEGTTVIIRLPADTATIVRMEGRQGDVHLRDRR